MIKLNIGANRPSLSKFIPEDFSNNTVSCYNIHYNKDDAEELVSAIDHLAKEVFQKISKFPLEKISFMPLPDLIDNGPVSPYYAWINKYGPGQRTGFHNHDDAEFNRNASHFAIYIIDVGSQPETLVFFDGDTQNNFIVSPGELYIGHCTERHGMLPVNNYLCALMFKINAYENL
jgi:hypothetical protein